MSFIIENYFEKNKETKKKFKQKYECFGKAWILEIIITKGFTIG